MISVVNQDTFLFHGTVEDNIRMGRPDASDADVRGRRARPPTSTTSSRPCRNGYDTVIGESGIKLSGGQRQRIAIARALLRDTPILVLDEALSAVDAENEAVIQEALDRLMRGRTTLILAHRLSSVIDCDRILVLDRTAASSRAAGTRALMKARRRLCAADGGAGARRRRCTGIIDASPAGRRGRRRSADLPGAGLKPVTEGIIKAEGLELAAARRGADEAGHAAGRAGSPPPSCSACCAWSPSSASAC